MRLSLANYFENFLIRAPRLRARECNSENRCTEPQQERTKETMQITSPLEQELTQYLDLSVLEQKVTAQNMANVDTPGYRTVGFDFAEAMRRSVERIAEQREEQQNLAVAKLDGGESGLNAAEPMLPVSDAVEVHRIGGLLERPDGNDVSVDRAGLKMAEAQLQFQIGMALLKQQFTEINDAIHAAD